MGRTNDIDVSVVVPVYNAGECLTECLDSLLQQQAGGCTFEIVAVDDGSTDGSGEVLDSYAAGNPLLRVIHQENSGGPGKPRNVGIEQARGRYIFFCDADDYLAPESLRRMVAFADEHQSDLVVPKLVGIDGRWIRQSIYRETQVDADLFKVSQSAGPIKLFRRSVVEAHALRFPDEPVPAEDTIFLFKMLTVSKRISILADYDYYFVRLREHQVNLSFQRTDPAKYARSLIVAAEIIENSLGNRAIERAIILELFRRVGLNKYKENYARTTPQRQQGWVEAHREIVERFLPPGSELALKSPERERLVLVREGRVADLVALAAVAARPKVLGRVVRVGYGARGVCFSGTVRLENHFRRFDAVGIEVRARGSNGTLAYRTYPGELSIPRGQSEAAPEYQDFQVTLDDYLADSLPDDIWDVYVVVAMDGTEVRGRLAVDGAATLRKASRKGRSIAPFTTKHRNLSVKISPAGVVPGLRQLPRRALGKAKRTFLVP
jgi:glycosyltransferase involved in cell wall biosynthesis